MADKKEKSIQHLIGVAESVIKAEAEELLLVANRIDHDVVKAAEIILNHSGKIVICGLGKSGIIGQKIVATLNSTGTRAVFLHAGEALHGDLGIYKPGDPTILLSKSGSTEEILQLIPVLREFNSVLIGIVGNVSSPVAEHVDVIIDASVSREADPLGVVPTSSTTVTMAIGDALAAVLMVARNFKHEDFARFHPGGSLGKRLRLRVKDIMKPLRSVATAKATDSLQKVVIEMTKKPQGAALIVDDDNRLEGIFTEGDVRRCMALDKDFHEIEAGQAMTANPIFITSDAILNDAINLMEDRSSQISVLPVVENGGKICIGLIRLHDIYQTKLV